MSTCEAAKYRVHVKSWTGGESHPPETAGSRERMYLDLLCVGHLLTWQAPRSHHANCSCHIMKSGILQANTSLHGEVDHLGQPRQIALGAMIAMN